MGKYDSTTTTVNKPLPEQYEGLKEFWSLARDRADIPYEFFPGSTVAERDPLSMQAREMTAMLGQDDYTDAAKGFVGQVLGGEYLKSRGQNPYLDERFSVMADRMNDAYSRITAPSLASRFGAAGSVGGSGYEMGLQANERSLGEALGRTATDVYYGDYENRMQDMFRAVGMTPMLRNMEYGDIGQTRQQGAIEENYLQRLLQDQISRFNFNQQEPDMRLDMLGQRMSTPSGYGTQTQETRMPNTGGLSIGLGLLGMLGTLGGAALMGPLANAGQPSTFLGWAPSGVMS